MFSLFRDLVMLVTQRSQPRMEAFGLVSAQDGLSRWKDRQITVLRKAGGLPDDTPASRLQDGRGRIWGFRGQGLAYLKDGRSLAIAARRGGRVHFIAGDKALA